MPKADVNARKRATIAVANGAIPDGKSNPNVAANPRIGFNGDEVRKRLRAYDRTPFLDLLALMMECAPNEDALQRLAKSHPDKYIAAISQLARTAGFTDRTEQTHNINLNIGQMSDSQIEDRARQLAAQLSLPPPGGTEYAEFEEIEHEVLPIGATVPS